MTKPIYSEDEREKAVETVFRRNQEYAARFPRAIHDSFVISIDLQCALARACELLRESPYPSAFATPSTSEQVSFAVKWQKRRLAFLAEQDGE